MKKTTCPSSLFIPGLLLLGCIASAPLAAHQVNGSNLNGKSPAHQHVYKRNSFGNGLTAGHYVRSAGSHGMVIWSASPERAYGRALPGFSVPQGYPSQNQTPQQGQAAQPLQRQMFQPATGFGTKR